MEDDESKFIDVAPGLWLWQVQYREWPQGEGWDGKVACTCVESGGEIALLDPLAPANETSVMAMIETTGRVTEVCKFSRLEDQITILVSIPSVSGEDAERHCLDWVVPTGTVKVGTTIKVAFLE